MRRVIGWGSVAAMAVLYAIGQPYVGPAAQASRAARQDQMAQRAEQAQQRQRGPRPLTQVQKRPQGISERGR